MSFMKRAREAAENAAESARRAAEQASQMAAGASAGQARPATGDDEAAAAEVVAAGRAVGSDGAVAVEADPPHETALQGQVFHGLASVGKSAREAAGLARRGMSAVVEKIDPGTLADVIIKATALQEMTNRALRGKGSVYRISEVSISASIPPSISFAIARLDDPEERPTGLEKTSSDLVEDLPADGEMELAIDLTQADTPS